MEFKEVFQPIIDFIKGLQKKESENSKVAAKERLKLVLMQDRASVSPDFFEMMKKEIIDVIKKYIEIDEEALEVQLTRGFEGGLEGPALYANIPIKNIKPVAKKGEEIKDKTEVAIEETTDSDKEDIQEEIVEEKQIVEEEGEITEIVQEEIIENVEEEKVGTVENKAEEEIQPSTPAQPEKVALPEKPKTKKNGTKKNGTKSKSKK